MFDQSEYDRQRILNREVVEGWRDQFCKLCGLGPFVALTIHIAKVHDRKEYVRKYGKPLDSDAFRINHRILLSEKIDDGKYLVKQKQDVCKRGHPLAGKNILYLGTRRRRTCRECSRARKRSYWKAKKYRNRKCLLCREWFTPWRHDQKCCCTAHGEQLWREKHRRRA